MQDVTGLTDVTVMERKAGLALGQVQEEKCEEKSEKDILCVTLAIYIQYFPH